MNYITKHPEKSLHQALSIPNERALELESILNEIIKSGDFSNIDDLTTPIAPHINTPEEGFLVASMIHTVVNRIINA
jgi:hypothetical protein